MKEDQFEHIENRIREALENNQPAFEEASWDKMSLLLAKEKRRRFPLWWVLLPVVIAGLIVLYINVRSKESRMSPEIVSAVNSTTGLRGNDAVQNHDRIAERVSNKSNKQAQPADSGISDLSSIQSSIRMPGNVARANKYVIGLRAKNEEAARADDDKKQSFNSNRKTSIKITASNLSEVENEKDSQEPAATNDKNSPVNSAPASVVLVPEKKLSNTSRGSSETVPQVATPEAAVLKPTTKKQTKNSGFYVMAIAGIDNSSVKFLSFKNSDPAFQYGLGLGFEVSNKVSLQTGFLTSHKKYIAGPGDYSPKAGSYLSMVDIRKVDANCLVFEIPLSVKYNFYQGKAINIFGTTGLSSYIMKREDYQYEYLRNNTLNYTSWTYKGNRHLFSVLSVSAGVEKKLSQEFSVLAAPAIYIPLHGVGDGKVKLYSAALQIALKYNPIRKAKKGN